MSRSPIGLGRLTSYENIWETTAWDAIQFAAAVLSHHRRSKMADQADILDALGLSEIDMARAKRIAARQSPRADDEWLLVVAHWFMAIDDADPDEAAAIFGLQSAEPFRAAWMAMEILRDRSHELQRQLEAVIPW